jgi:outer membrane immunogenic protein
LGYNYQIGDNIVVGIEVDFQGATVRGGQGFVGTATSSAPTLLIYATGGLAYGGLTAGNSISQAWGPSAAGLPYQSPGAVGHFSDVRAGWTLGGGLEWLFLPNWSAKVEYLHYGLGAVRFASGPLLTDYFPAAGIGSLFPAAVGKVVSDIAIPTTSTRFYGDLSSRRGELSLHPELTHRLRCSILFLAVA